MGFWNVAGIKNKDNYFWDQISSYDIVGLVETWIEEKDWEKWEAKLPDKFVWKCTPAKRIKKKGRAMGGIITGINRNLKETKEGINIEQVQERVIEIDNEVWHIYTIYSKGEIRLIKEEFEKKENINDVNIVLGGDFNARIADKGNLINVKDGTEIKRNSKDKILNKEGERLLQLLEENGLSVLNGNTIGDEEGNYTYIDTNGESVIDYCIVNEKARHKIKSFQVQLSVETQHQLLKIELQRQKIMDIEIERTSLANWSEEGIRTYKKNLAEYFSVTQDMEEIITKTQASLPIRTIKRKHTNPRNGEINNASRAVKI